MRVWKKYKKLKCVNRSHICDASWHIKLTGAQRRIFGVLREFPFKINQNSESPWGWKYSGTTTSAVNELSKGAFKLSNNVAFHPLPSGKSNKWMNKDYLQNFKKHRQQITGSPSQETQSMAKCCLLSQKYL